MQQRVNLFTTIALYFFSFGIHTSVSIPAGLHVFGLVPSLYYLFNSQKYLRRLPASAFFLALFIAGFVVSGLWNFQGLQDPIKSLGSIKYWLFALLFCVPLSEWMKSVSQKHLRVLVTSVLVFIVIAAVVGIVRSEFQYDLLKLSPRSMHPRAGGFFGYMRYAYGLQFFLILMLGFIAYQDFFKKFVSIPSVLIAYVFGWTGLIMSETRGAFIATLIGSSALIYFKNRQLGMKILIAATALLVFALGIVFSGGSSKIRLLEKYNSTSNTMRLSQFQSAIHAFKEAPVLGLGPSQLRYNVERLKNTNDLPHKEYVGQHAHNIFLEILANFGVFGLLAFLGWLGFWGKELVTSTWFNRSLIFPCYIAILVSGQVEYLFNSTGSFIILLLYSASIANILKDRENESRSAT